MILQLFTAAAAQLSTVSAAPSLPTSLDASTAPVSISSRYSVVPAAAPPRLACCCCVYGRKPDPAMTMNWPLAFTAWPTAGSDHVWPTLFSADVAVLLMSPYGVAVVEIV